MLHLIDFVACRKRFYNLSRALYLTQLQNTVGRKKFRTPMIETAY